MNYSSIFPLDKVRHILRMSATVTINLLMNIQRDTPTGVSANRSALSGRTARSAMRDGCEE